MGRFEARWLEPEAKPAATKFLALLVWNGFLYLEYLRQPPLARPFSHGSFAPVGDDDDWTFKPQFAENAAVSFGSSGASARLPLLGARNRSPPARILPSSRTFHWSSPTGLFRTAYTSLKESAF
jgi:hypothetical protein